MRHATKLKSSQPSGKGHSAEAFVLTVVGGVGRKTLALHKPPRARKRPVRVRSGEDHCVLCDAPIERFDREVFNETGRCQPCDEALERGT